MGERHACLIDYKLKIMDSKKIGNLTELQCITRFYELGFPVSIPYGDSEKYDFIVDVRGKLYKMQCKHAAPSYTEDGQLDYITIRTVWQTGYTRNKSAERHKYTSNDIDYFVTHWEGKNYIISVNECSTQKVLRVLPPKNNQVKGVNFLYLFEDEEVCKNL